MKPLFVLAVSVWALEASAVTVQTFGSGATVGVTNMSAMFAALNSGNVVHLDTNQEGGLWITTSADSWAADMNMAAKLNPFHPFASDGGFFAISAGNQDWVTIRTTDSATIYGVEFMYGNTWTTGDIYGPFPWGNANAFLEWQTTLNDGTILSSGQAGPLPMLALATVVGFYDHSGFDRLLVRARMSSTSPDQAIALDNLNVMLTNVPPSPVIWASDFAVDPATKTPSLPVYDTIPGCQYRMVYTEDLASGIWTPVTMPGWQPGGGPITFTDRSTTGMTRRFYRVEVR